MQLIQNIVASYQYDAYGNITSQTGSMASINPYTYRGYRYDKGLSWYYLNSRYYVPEIGRFLSSDGLLGQFGDIISTNMYAYCSDNPVMYSDISGYAWWHVAIGAVVIIGLFVAANVLTGGLASVLSAAAWGALSGAVIGGFFGGLSTNADGKLTFNWENASKSFMVGAIVGGIAGGLGSTSHLIGETVIKTTTLLQRIAYIGMQAGINSAISASVAAVSGLITHSFSWTAVGISAGFGAFAGATGVFPGISDGVRGILIGIGLGFAEGSINEAIEWQSIWSNNRSDLIFDRAY